MPFIDKKLLQASKDGKYVCANEGEAYQYLYTGYSIVPDDKYGGTKFSFKFKDQEGKEFMLNTKAKKVLSKMAYISPGSKLAITRFGEGKEKNFDIAVISTPKMPAQEELPTINQPEEQPEEELPVWE